MKYLLLDIDDTIAPFDYKERDAIFIDLMGIRLGFPNYLAEWLSNLSDNEIRIVWCTKRDPSVTTLIEHKMGFTSYGRISFIKQKVYPWKKLASIIDFCNNHDQDTIVLADNDLRWGINGIKNLPKNINLVRPSDDHGCLSKNDLNLIESF